MYFLLQVVVRKVKYLSRVHKVVQKLESKCWLAMKIKFRYIHLGHNYFAHKDQDLYKWLFAGMTQNPPVPIRNIIHWQSHNHSGFLNTVQAVLQSSFLLPEKMPCSPGTHSSWRRFVQESCFKHSSLASPALMHLSRCSNREQEQFCCHGNHWPFMGLFRFWPEMCWNLLWLLERELIALSWPSHSFD